MYSSVHDSYYPITSNRCCLLPSLYLSSLPPSVHPFGRSAINLLIMGVECRVWCVCGRVDPGGPRWTPRWTRYRRGWHGSIDRSSRVDGGVLLLCPNSYSLKVYRCPVYDHYRRSHRCFSQLTARGRCRHLVPVYYGVYCSFSFCVTRRHRTHAWCASA
jgi:hypothetical protein